MLSIKRFIYFYLLILILLLSSIELKAQKDSLLNFGVSIGIVTSGSIYGPLDDLHFGFDPLNTYEFRGNYFFENKSALRFSFGRTSIQRATKKVLKNTFFIDGGYQVYFNTNKLRPLLAASTTFLRSKETALTKEGNDKSVLNYGFTGTGGFEYNFSKRFKITSELSLYFDLKNLDYGFIRWLSILITYKFQ